MRPTARYAALAAIILFGASLKAAHADTLFAYQLSGGQQPNNTGLTGTFTYDATTRMVSAEDIVFTHGTTSLANDEFTTAMLQAGSSDLLLATDTSTAQTLRVSFANDLGLDASDAITAFSVVGPSGGSLIGANALNANPVAAAAATPEPGTLSLLGTGMFFGIGVMRRKARQLAGI